MSRNNLKNNGRGISLVRLLARESDRTRLADSVATAFAEGDGLAEVRSLAVRRDRIGKGIGRDLVLHCLDEARELGAGRVFVLTYQEGFFRKLGFNPVDKKELPHKIWTDCLNCIKFPNCDETALLIEPEKPDMLAEGILTLANNTEFRKTLGENARQQVCREYSWAENALRVIKPVAHYIGEIPS